MSKAQSTQVSDPFFQPSAYCPNEACGAVIPQTHVAVKIDPRAGTRNVRAHCQHCGRMYEADYRLYGGNWSPVGEVRLMTDERRKRGFLARIAHLEGVHQREAISA